jgi:chromosomal replication initiator protein
VTADELWGKGTAALREQLTPSTWSMWFQGVRPLSYDGSLLVLGVPNAMAAERIRSSYAGMLCDAIHDRTGELVRIDLLVDTDRREDQAIRVRTADDPQGPIDVALGDGAGAGPDTLLGSLVDDRHPTIDSTPWTPGTLNPRYTFDQFVIGASNRFAHAAALSVAESPARSYNPLFIYGPAGLGKTHLLHAIGHHVRTVFRNKRVRYVSTEAFMNEFVEAIRAKEMPGFKRRYRDLDVLLIDDIQFLERTQELQEEFFHTFNQLHGEGGQIVISSDRPPKSIASLEDRLRTRFEWGLITDVQPPEFETRLAILRKKAARSARVHRHEHQRQHPRARGRADPGCGLLEPQPGRAVRRARPDRPRRHPPADHPPDRHTRAHPRRDRQDVRLDARRPVRQEPAAAARDRSPDRHVRDARAHRPELPAHRRGLRWP